MDKYLELYLKELEELPVYSDEEIREAKRKAVADDDKDAQDILMNHYLRSVVDIARTYVECEVPSEDLIGEGNIGMMTAIRALATLDDPDEVDGFVGKLIMDAMDAAIYEDNDARESMQVMVDRINEINDKARELSEDMRRPVTAEELSQETGISENEIREAMRMSGGQIEGLVP
jgi:DNA-directed RNA polymerase sigma subunit (sigma70/sigma32)